MLNQEKRKKLYYFLKFEGSYSQPISIHYISVVIIDAELLVMRNKRLNDYKAYILYSRPTSNVFPKLCNSGNN